MNLNNHYKLIKINYDLKTQTKNDIWKQYIRKIYNYISNIIALIILFNARKLYII